MAVLALYAVGNAIGAAVGGTFLGVTAAAWGGAIATTIGNALLAPTQKSQGPRLSDLKATQLTYGSVLPYVEGHPRLAGVLIWQSIKHETPNTQSSGGSGGGAESTTFTYDIDLFILVAENPGYIPRRIWMNGELVWTRADDGDADSIEGDAELWTRLTAYTGAADQLPDPAYEAAVGVGNAPAYRTRSTIFIEGLKLGVSGQLPNITFEIVAQDGGSPFVRTASPYWSVSADRDYTSTPPQGAYVGGSLAVAQPAYGLVRTTTRKPARVTDQVSGGPAYMTRAAQGNADVPVVGFGPFAGRAAFYLQGDAGAVDLAIDVPGGTDWLGNDDLRYSLFGTHLAYGTAAPLGTGAGSFDGCVGAMGNVYVHTSDGAAVVTLAHGDVADSLACTSDSVYVLTGGTVTQYRPDSGTWTDPAWSVVDSFAGPGGTGMVIFTDLAGALCCANAGAEVYRCGAGVWTLVHTLVYETADGPIDLGTGSARHFADSNYVYAARVDATQGVALPDTRWRESYFLPTNTDKFFRTLDGAMAEALAGWVAGLLTTYGTPREVSSAGYTVNSIVDVALTDGVYAFTKQANVTLEANVRYGYGGDSTPPGYYLQTRSDVLYQFAYGPPDASSSALVVYRALAVGLLPLNEPTLEDVVLRQCARGGMDLAHVDASALAEIPVHAMGVSALSSPRQVIEQLQGAYFFTAVESDVLRFPPRGGEELFDIPYDDLVVDGDAPALPINKANDIEIPAQVSVKFANTADDYQDGNEMSFRLTDSQNTVQVETPLAFSPQEAKRIADGRVIDGAASILSFGPFKVSRDYAALEPSDVGYLNDAAGNRFRVRLQKGSTAGGVLTFEAVLDDPTAVNSEAVSSTAGYTNSTTIRLPMESLLEVLDIPILRDADNNAGVYVVAKGAEVGAWPGAAIFKTGSGAGAERVATCELAGTFGTATSVLASGPVGVFDEAATLTVDIGAGALSSATRDVVLNSGTNAMLVGDEIIQFRTATLVGEGVYTLTGLLRGLRGTEWAIGAHGAGERVVLLDAALKRVSLSTAEVGTSLSWKAVTLGRTADTADSAAYIHHANGLKPFAPVDLRFARDSSGNLTITLQRRSRLVCRLFGDAGISVPLGEEVEAYDLDVYTDVTRTTVKSSFGVGGPSVTYTAAEQVADFGSPQAIVYVAAYQKSSTAGRGYAATAQG